MTTAHIIIGESSPGGSDTYVQFNDGGVLNGVSGFTYNKTSNLLSLTAATSTLTVGSTASSTGTIKLPNAGSIYQRNAANSADVLAISVDASNIVQLGDTNASGINLGHATLTFTSSLVTPTIKQSNDATNSITGDAFTIQAQNATGTTSTGGNLVLTSGTGTSSAGSVILQTGGTAALTVTPTLNTFASSVAIGSTVATAGTIRLPNASTVYARNVANNANLPILTTDSNDYLYVGTTSSYASGTQVAVINQYVTTSGVQYFGTGGTTRLQVGTTGVMLYNPGDPLTFGYTGAATAGIIRLANNQAMQARNAANNANIYMIGVTSSNVLTIANDNNAASLSIGYSALITSHVGGHKFTVRNISADVTLDTTTTDMILLVDTSAARNITLPAPTTGRTFVIKDKTGTAAANNVTLVRNGSEKIEYAAASKVLNTNAFSYMIVSDGVDWYLI